MGIMIRSTPAPHDPIPKPSIKFLCSYGGRILPRYPDGKLRYYGGETRVLSVERNVSFPDLLVKLGEMFGSSVNLRCQFPTEDLDALVSITSDEDLANLIEEYDRVAAAPPSSLKIRAFLSSPKTTKPPSLPSSPASSSSNDSTSPKSPPYSSTAGVLPPRCPASSSNRCIRHAPLRPPPYPINV
ncbi:uncharacterized protein LOC127263481 isoform X4 [Andrographis paniculata]|uniref:uncharacterized protein LOC127263481 isoform X4 n=1 Tax=Andrographis paniculata TaxID=175694 RepID=UPI0021E96110|nr:uncharacterized protein LOC127263481 isoform X4 [Andrographis paniculata]XP_051148484.1 uncharacterized protein LOC127263481 isoform X4 [Andrographis paniculata]XP_051148485.1 uncharacterized protein LOC127263481 isoform X4 [Andrographis paniculata]